MGNINLFILFKMDNQFETFLQKYREDRSKKDEAAGIIIDSLAGKGHAIGYTRVSLEIQKREGKSMDSQRTDIENYCKLKNLILDDIVEEPDESGADRTRPKLTQLIQSIKPGTKIVAYALNRVARDTRKLLELKEILHDKGCSMYFIDRGLDTSDASTEMIVTIMAAVDEEYRKAQNRTISNVMQDMSRKGILTTRPPYGWKAVNKKLIHDEGEQAVINIIQSIIEAEPTISISAICRKLDSLNIKIRKSAKIYPTSIKNIINANNLGISAIPKS